MATGKNCPHFAGLVLNAFQADVSALSESLSATSKGN
jgi:hypothetical protein